MQLSGTALAEAGPVVFTDRDVFNLVVGEHTLITFDDPLPCQRIRFSCVVTISGVDFGVFAEIVPEGSIIQDALTTTAGSAVFAGFPAGTIAVGFDLAFSPGVGASVSFSPGIPTFALTEPGFFGLLSPGVDLTGVLWSPLNCCAQEVQIDNVAVKTVPEPATGVMFGAAAVLIFCRWRLFQP